MKLVAIVLVLMFVMTPLAFARGGRSTTTYIENDMDHPMGLGVDLKIAETKNQNVSVSIQEKYDFENELNSLFFVVGIDVAKILRERSEKKAQQQ